jgi:hypothetical protein
MLLQVAQALPRGPAQIRLCEEAARCADLLNEVVLAYQARQHLTDAAMFGGRPDLLLVSYSWCVAQYDRQPELFNASSFLWRQKWIVTTLPKFPQISRESIASALDDMERRFRAYGSTMQPVWLQRREVAMLLGELEEAAAAHHHFKRLARGELSDCAICEIDATIDFHFGHGRLALGLKKAEKLFESSRSCAEVPHRTHASVLLPLLKAGRLVEALAHQRQGYAMIKNGVSFGDSHGMHIAFLALTGNDAQALRLFQRHAADNMDGTAPYREYQFARYSWLALHTLAGRKKRAKLRLPKVNHTIAGDGEYLLDDLAEGVRKMAAEIADRFDRRNGNDYYSRQLDSTVQWWWYATKMR